MSRDFRMSGNVATDAIRSALLCLGPNGDFDVRREPRPKPAADEVEVAVTAAAVNPIDARRAQGYGRRLLSLLGAARFPLV